MSEKQKRTGMIVGISAAVVVVVVVISLIASGAGAAMLAPKERVVKSYIGTNEILAIPLDHGNGFANSLCVPSQGAGYIFQQLEIEDDEFAKVLGIDSVVCSNGTRRIIQMDNAYISTTSTTNLGTTFAFHYLNSWYIFKFGIREDANTFGMPTPAETLDAIWEIAS